MSENAIDLAELKAQILAELQPPPAPAAPAGQHDELLKVLLGGEEPLVMFGEVSTGVYAIAIEKDGRAVYRPCPPYATTLILEYLEGLK